MARDFDPITLEILWSRLIAIVDEASATLVRTSFSTIVRESNDFACVLLDAQGNSLAQSSLSIPSFIGTLPVTVRHLLRRYPAETLRPGDILVTNDPWLGTGHLNDINVAVPIFHLGRLIAIAASTAHAPDIGGRMRSPDNHEVFEEGLRIPVCKLYDGGRPNEMVAEFIRHNVRVPDEVLGDLRAQIAANELAGRRLIDLVEEYGVEDLGALARTIQAQSEAATRAAIRELPAGVYPYTLVVDGLGEQLTIRLTLTIDHAKAQLICDYSGTSPQQPTAFNVVPNYTFAYTAFGVKCVVAPDVPNNEGCFRPLVVTAPEGCILNPRFPAAVGARAAIGHYLPVAVFGALAEAVPERVRAAPGSPMWCVSLSGVRESNRPFAGMFFFNGGMAGAKGQDGLTCVSFPSNLSNTPTEVLEHLFPLHFVRKEIRADSGGAGQGRGGCGQTVECVVENPTPVTVAFMASRISEAPEGLFGGAPGKLGSVLLNGEWINPKFRRTLQPGDRLALNTPGGGGFGPPAQRDRLALCADVEDGVVSAEATAREYSLAPRSLA
ncbi:MAG: hydantoinase B/oxoprolinase family protein [Chloroflexi bacterium]|nr:hydantoinase B/oxoprolinase family protein [Chloroflexota bacterium]